MSYARQPSAEYTARYQSAAEAEKEVSPCAPLLPARGGRNVSAQCRHRGNGNQQTNQIRVVHLSIQQ